MKEKVIGIFLMLLFLIINSCDKETFIDFSLPNKVVISDFVSSPTQVKVEWDAAEGVSTYILKHYKDDVFLQEFRTSDLFQFINIDITELTRHRFQIFTECEGEQAAGLNAYVDVVNGSSVDCAPPTNLEIVNTTDTTITFTWEGPANAASYIVYDYSTEPPTQTPTDLNTFTLTIDTASLSDNAFAVQTVCYGGELSSLTYNCGATHIDINKMRSCDEGYFCGIVNQATYIEVKDSRNNLKVSGSPTLVWHAFCCDITYPCN